LNLDGTLAFKKPPQKWFEHLYVYTVNGRKIFCGQNYEYSDKGKMYLFDENSKKMFNGVGFDEVDFTDEGKFMIGTIGENEYVLTANGNILKRINYNKVDTNDFNAYIEKMLAKGYNITDLVDDVYKEKKDSYGNICIRFDNGYNILSPDNRLRLEEWCTEWPNFWGDCYRIHSGEKRNIMSLDGRFLFDETDIESWPYDIVRKKLSIGTVFVCNYGQNGGYSITSFEHGNLLKENALSVRFNDTAGFVIVFYKSFNENRNLNIQDNYLIFDYSLTPINKEGLFNLCNKSLESHSLEEVFGRSWGEKIESSRYVGVKYINGFNNLYDKNENRLVFKDWIDTIDGCSENVISCTINNKLVLVNNNGEINPVNKEGRNYTIKTVYDFNEGIGIAKGSFNDDMLNGFEAYIKENGEFLVKTGYKHCSRFSHGIGCVWGFDGYNVIITSDGKVLGEGMKIRNVIDSIVNEYYYKGEGIAEVQLEGNKVGYLTMDNEFIPKDNNAQQR